jgi:hypothetical protein
MGNCESIEEESQEDEKPLTLSDVISMLDGVVKGTEGDDLAEIAKEVGSLPGLGNALEDYYRCKEKERLAKIKACEDRREEERREEVRKREAEEQKMKDEMERVRLAMEKADAEEKERLAAEKEKMRQEAEALANRPPPIFVSQMYKRPGDKWTRNFISWQKRTVVLDMGILYYYESSVFDESGNYTAPYGQNIKGYFSLRRTMLLSDLDDQDPKDLVIRKDFVGGAGEAKDKTDTVAASSTDRSSVVGSNQDYDVVLQVPFVERKLEALGDFQAHIDYANKHNIATPPAASDKRTEALMTRGGQGRFLDQRDSAKAIEIKKEAE